jgi:hypothetical protein
MKCKVKIQTTIEIDWEPENDNGEILEDEGEITRDLYQQVKDNPMRFIDKTWPEPEFFVAVSKG